MKKLALFTGGHKFHLDDLLHLNESLTETITALSLLHGENYYLSDPQMTYTPGGGVGGANLLETVSGWLVYKGEPCAFNAQSVSGTPMGGQEYAWVPVSQPHSEDPITYVDSNSHSTLIEKKVLLQVIDTASPPADYVLASEVAFIKDIVRGYMGHAWTQVQAAGAGSAPAFFTDRSAVSSIPLFTVDYGDLLNANVFYRRRDYVGKFQFKGVVKKTGTTTLNDYVSLFSIKAEDVLGDGSIGGIVSAFFGEGSAVQYAHIRLVGNVVQAMLPGTGDFTNDIYIMLDGLTLNYDI